MGNLVGALGMVGLAWWSGMLHMGGDAVARTAFGIAAGKVALDLDVAFVRGILCNVLVCLAVWLCFSARNVSSKILCIVFPIAGFVAMGFEHSIANMYFVPLAILAAADPAYGEALAAVGNPAGLDISGFLANLIPVTIGNIVGGGLFVALTYYHCCPVN